MAQQLSLLDIDSNYIFINEASWWVEGFLNKGVTNSQNLPIQKGMEVGILGFGKKKAQYQYFQNIIKVFINLKSYLKSSANCFKVASDCLQLYPNIINSSRYELISKFKRLVLNRVEKYRYIMC